MPDPAEPSKFKVEEPSRLRLDLYLRRRFPGMSRSALQRLIEEQAVRVNTRPVKPTYTPRTGDEIEIHWPAPIAALAAPEDVPLSVLFEDADLIVINKPAGMVVHPAAGHDAHTLVNALLHHCAGQLSGIGGVARPGIVHRLDKETSGCLVAAKNDFTHLSLSCQFEKRKVAKTYQAIVCGDLPRIEGTIRAAIARHPSHRKRMAVTDGSGRDALTTYRLLERLNAASRVEVQLHSGRTHQIRVHFQHIGFPLAGDSVYGKRQNRRLTELTGYHAPRQLLHASRLSFAHPRSGETIGCEAPLPADFQEALNALRLR